MKKALSVLFTFFSSLAVAQDAASLFRDLEIASYWDRKMVERLPSGFNYLFECGIFVTPTARMSDCGEIGFGVASLPPYLLYNARMQPFSHLEFSANYRIFRHVSDAGLSPHGFGDMADRQGNAKLAFCLPEDSFNDLPGIVVGVEDFIGTKRFTTYYIVGTQVWIDYGVETSLGWGTGRYSRGPSCGFFASAQYYPFFHCENKWLKGLGCAIEYDPTNYRNDPHPDARKVSTHVNCGLRYQLWDTLNLSLSSQRGREIAMMGSLRYNWGKCEGFLPKVKDPLPYSWPKDNEPLGCYRPEEVMSDQLAFTLDTQGFTLTTAWLQDAPCGTRLWIRVINECYRRESVVKNRLTAVLAGIIPSNIDTVVVILETYGLPCQQYVFTQQLLFDYSNHLISPYEYTLLTPRREVCMPNPEMARQIFYDRLDPWRFSASPRYESFLGSAKGKYKYDVGVRTDFEGFLPYDIFYELQFSYTIFSTNQDVADFDFYNPSQLPNVLTDYVNYRKKHNFSTDKACLQKNFNLGKGWFGKLAGGYFQVNYGGVAAEFLFYPPCSYVAFGLEGAVMRKRRYTGLWFQDKLRQLQGYTPTYHSYSLLSQYFVSLYCDIPTWKVAGKISGGGFLAYDKGVLFSLTRYFDSGLRITGWITMTNAKDSMHRANFYNKGIAVELPFDLFYKCSSRRVWSHGMAEWLRDAGAQIPIGVSLFDMINRERRD